MTDNEIIRCLRYCRAGDCENCKALDVCDATFSFHKEALDLINRQKAEVERLREIANPKCQKCVSRTIECAKSEAIKEFTKRLKEKLQWDVEFDNKLVFESDIDNLVKEMTEVNENE